MVSCDYLTLLPLRLLIFVFLSRANVMRIAATCNTTLPVCNPLTTLALDSNIFGAQSKILSRRRRYVAFPEGSSASAAICLTIGVLGNPEVSYLSWAVNWGVAYNLPSYAWARKHAQGFKNETKKIKALVQRRSRRDLYEKIELAIDNMGYNGHACIARALCESSKYLRTFGTNRGNMIEELVKTLFSWAAEHVELHEDEAIHQYDRIYRRAPRSTRDCSVEFAQCHFSLLELALGRYSVPPRSRGGAGAGDMGSYAFM